MSTLAEKVDHLFRTVRPHQEPLSDSSDYRAPGHPGNLGDPAYRASFSEHSRHGGAEFTYEQVAAGCRAGGGPTISAAYVWMLRRGKRDNPTMKHLQALAGFFGVHPAYFFDDPPR